MNWFTENKIFSSLLVLIGLGVLALAYLTFSEKGKYSEAVESYQSGVQRLIGMRGLVPYRNEENLAKYGEQVTNLKQLTDNLHEELLKRQGDIPPLEPAVFQQRLRDAVSQTIERANQRGVQLPAKFYLGFDRYEKELPRNDIAGLLNWQLTAVQAVVDRLVELKVTRVDKLTRPEVPGELAPEAPAKEIPLLKKYPFEVVFYSYPSSVAAILNDLVSKPQFTIARTVRVENEQTKAPARPGASPAAGDAAAAAPPEPAVDKIVIGKEKVTTSIIIDLVQFTPRKLAKK